MKDYNGIEIEVGTLVAFNYSGDVRLGRVKRFVRNNQSVIVQHLQSETTTKVKRVSSLCAVEPEELLIQLL